MRKEIRQVASFMASFGQDTKVNPRIPDAKTRSLRRALIVEEAEELDATLYQDPRQAAVDRPGAIPNALKDFARNALDKALQDPQALARVLGEYLTEPKANVWFEERSVSKLPKQLKLDRRSRMMYDDKHIFLNGESWRASGRDAQLMRILADQRALSASQILGASQSAKKILLSWLKSGWLKSY